MAGWTREDDLTLRRLYAAATWDAILAAFPGRTKRAIWNRAHRIGAIRAFREFSQETRQHLAALARANKPRLGKVVHLVISHSGVPGKVCSCCHQWHPLAKFARHPECSGGVRAICSTCSGKWAYNHHRANAIAAVRRYQKQHPEKVRLHKQAGDRRRHGRMIQGRGVKASELRELMKLFGGICAYCRVRSADTFDHIQPLSRNGQHEIENLLPACKACNFEKHQLTLAEWQAKKAKEA